MWTYSKVAFRVETLGPSRFELEPGTLIVATHRRETDVPVLAPQLYYRARLWRRQATRMSFAARDDMFLRGFFAGFPPGLGPGVRRALYPVGVGRWLPRVEVHPIRSARVARLVEILEVRPEEPLNDLVSPPLVARLHARAAGAGLRRPLVGSDVLRAEYADVLWSPVSPNEGGSALSEFWSRRAGRAAGEFRALVDLLRSGGIVLVFPEGRPSPCGEIGPLRSGLAALIRRGRPTRVQPIALAYDPLVRGRTRVAVSIPTAVDAPSTDPEAVILALLRRSMPLTAGQVVASCRTRSRSVELDDLGRAFDAAIDGARADGRPIEAALLDRDKRRSRVVEAVTASLARPRALDYLAREFASARGR